MKILVTGGTGFVGSHLVRRLSKTDHEINCLARRGSAHGELRKLGAHIVFGDVLDRASLLNGMAGCDLVVNLANVYEMWSPDGSVYYKVNVGGTRNVMECALESGARKVVHVSTAGVYGRPRDCPFTEESEAGPERFSEYSRSKYEGDLIAWRLFETEGLPLVVVYPGAVLGPGDTKPTGKYIGDLARGRMPATVFNEVVMTYVDVRDVAEAVLLAAEKDGNIGEKYLVGGRRLSFEELNSLIADISGVPTPALRLPDRLVFITAAALTAVSSITKKPPPWGMSLDQARMARAGFQFDGSKAERELGLEYRPIEVSVRDAIESLA